MAEARGLDGNEVLKNIYVAQAYNTNHQMLLIDNARELAEKLKKEGRPARLIIVDSLMTHFRAEYVGRGNLADRQMKLDRHLRDLRKLGELNNAAVVFTNSKENKNKSHGGRIVAKAVDYRVYIKFPNRKSDGQAERRVVELVKAPHLPSGKTEILITDAGIRCV